MDNEDVPAEAVRKKGWWTKLKTFVKEGSSSDQAEIGRVSRSVHRPSGIGTSSDSGSCTSGDTANGHTSKPSSGSMLAWNAGRSGDDAATFGTSQSDRYPVNVGRQSTSPLDGARLPPRGNGRKSQPSRQDPEQLQFDCLTRQQLFELVASAAVEVMPRRLAGFSNREQWHLLLAALHRKYGKSKAAILANQLMQQPEVLAALQGKLQGFAKDIQQASLPLVVQRRLKALKKLQAAAAQLEANFYKEVHELECRWNESYMSLYDKRKDFLSGTVEPTDSDCDWPVSDIEDDIEKETAVEEEAITSQIKDKLQLQPSQDNDESTKGIPYFWLTTLKNVDLLDEMIQEYDEPILRHLTDIRVQYSREPMGFTLEFHFSSNEYFSDSILTKWYEMTTEAENPLHFEGPIIVKCTGCAINWNKGKDVTVKLVKKKQKHKGRGTTRMVTKSVKTDSFFNFFSPPEVPEGQEEELEEETEELLERDFEIGQFIRERIVSRAVLYFTGEEAEAEVDDEEDEEEGDDEYDEDEDPDYDPASDSKAQQASKQECKQQ